MQTELYPVTETEIGPMVSESRVSVYDVMEAYDEGLSLYDICKTYNLSPLQLEPALSYIETHRERLEPELKEIQVKKAERERYYRAMAAKIQKKIEQQPVTPERATFYAWREKARRERAAKAAEYRAVYQSWLEENRQRAEGRVAERNSRKSHANHS